MPQFSRATIVVSGADSVTPFTTPEMACGSGLAAGNTATAIRQALLKANLPVFTAPVMNARGTVEVPSPNEFGAFGDPPPGLPAHMTIISIGDLDLAGEHLARFVEHLRANYGVREIDWVGHSNGGLFARAATRIMQQTGSPVTVRSLVTLGTPWSGANMTRILYGEISEAECRGDAASLSILSAMHEVMDRQLGLAPQNTHRYLQGKLGWNRAQLGVLDRIPTLLVAGSALTAEGGNPEFWPHDGLVSEHSALAQAVDDDILPHRHTRSLPLFHSIFIAESLGRPWPQSLTWNPEVLGEVVDFIQSA